MNKLSYRIKKHINPEINVGDVVKVIDGSGLTFKHENDSLEEDKSYYIIYSYPEITGIDSKLQDIDCVVIETGIDNYVATSINKNVYLQDIIIKIGNAKFRTCSKFVKKVEDIPHTPINGHKSIIKLVEP